MEIEKMNIIYRLSVSDAIKATLELYRYFI